MSNNKRLCTLFDEGNANIMLLSEDQIAIIGWLADRGYNLDVELMPDEPVELTFEDWAKKAIRNYSI